MPGVQRRNEIVVGVDGSEPSTAALLWAAHEAASRDCGLGIVHAADPAYYGLWTSTAMIRDGLRDTCRPITEAARALARHAEPGVPLYTAVVIGAAPHVLIAMSRRVQLVVVGRSGHGALSRMLLGSVPQRLMANAHCPVAAVGWQPHSTAGGPLTRVVAAIGDVAEQPETLEFALDLAHRRGVRVCVLHTIAPNESFTDEHHRLDKALAPWRDYYPDVTVRAEAHAGSLHTVIAGACGIGDLLVLGHHRHRAFTPHSVGAHTRAALDAAPCPVVVVHELPAGAEPAGQPLPAHPLEASLEGSSA